MPKKKTTKKPAKKVPEEVEPTRLVKLQALKGQLEAENIHRISQLDNLIEIERNK